MCGIAGSINFQLDEEVLFDAMKHRGPDEQSVYVHQPVRFYHLRLSILDISSGHQPMHLRDAYTIVFNGEIFNYRELIQAHNLQVHTDSDTEVLLLLYEKFGVRMMDLLDGMFAFAIHDKIKNQLFVARDRAGEKPLYYYFDQKKFAFASELNALRSSLPLAIDVAQFHTYLRFGSFFREATPYKNVIELAAGSYMIVNLDPLDIRHTRWWNVHGFYLQRNKDSLSDAIAKTGELLRLAVKRRLESSDLEVGAFLSGGIDSGLVTSIAAEYQNKLKTFTVSFAGEYDEAPLARLVAEKYNTQHHEIRISFDNLQNDVEDILSNYGEPFFDSSAIPSYYVSKASKQYVTVVLNGDGADELFAGYRRYVPFARYDFFNAGPLVRAAASLFTGILPPGHNKKSTYNYLYRLMNFASRSGIESYLSAGVDIFEGFTKHFVHTDAGYMRAPEELFHEINTSSLSGLQKLMNLDFDINLSGDLLVKMDIATMANSQEGRSPFLSRELLEYVPSLPDDFKIRGRTTKYLLRNLAKQYLPVELIDQPKRGFEIPLKHWVDHELKEVIADYLNASAPLYPELISRKFVANLMDNKINVSEEKRAKMIWTIFSLEVWYQRIYKKQNGT